MLDQLKFVAAVTRTANQQEHIFCLVLLHFMDF